MIDSLSLRSILLEPCFNNSKISWATGIIIRKNEKYYLATNWHVVTGRDSFTNQPLDRHAAIPDSLIIWHHVKSLQNNTIDWYSVKVPLYKSEEITPEDRLWIEHIKGKDVDVVLLPLKPTQNVIKIGTHETCLKIHDFDLNLASVDMIPIPAMPISIIGFPLGKSAGGILPIWVTGFIASEPTVDIDDNPVFYVNAPGRSGLSGAPVVLRLSGGYATGDGKFVLGGGYQTRFMGIYSGRIHENSDICRVWKPIVIDQILDNHEKIS